MKQKQLSLLISQCMFVGYSGMAVAVDISPEVLPNLQPNIPRPEQQFSPIPTLPSEKTPAETEKIKKSSVRLTVGTFKFSGNTQFSAETLGSLVAEFTGREIGIKELNQAIGILRNYYRQNGFVLTQVYLPTQDVKKISESSATVELAILEGTMGEVKADAAESLNDAFFQALAEYQLKTGDVVTEKNLVRNMMIINGLPGVRATSQLNPGAAVGSSDVIITVEPEQRHGGYLMYNNYGNRFTGRDQVGFGYVLNNPSGKGDQLFVTGRVSNDEGLRTIGGFYNTPINDAGTLLNLGYTYVDYQLNGVFRALGAEGSAHYLSAALEHPLIRNVRTGVSVRAGANYKAVDDEVKFFALNNRRDITSVEAGLQGDWINATGNIVYQWSAIATAGHVNFKDGPAQALDRAGLNTDGSFMKANLSTTRTQYFENALTWTTRFDYQIANDNLDIVEKFGIGAINRWRPFAYLPSQATDGGMLGNDIRKNFSVANDTLAKVITTFSPYAFYDYGRGRINHNPLTADNTVKSYQAGIGLDILLKQKWTLGMVFSHQKRDTEGAASERQDILWGQLRKDF